MKVSIPGWYILTRKKVVHFNPQNDIVPLAAIIFGKNKLKVSAYKLAVEADLQILRMLGATNINEVSYGIGRRVERFFSNIAASLNRGDLLLTDLEPILEMIAMSYNNAWLLIAELYQEIDNLNSIEKAKNAYKRFLSKESDISKAADAWRSLAYICYRSNDFMGEIQAFVERCRLSTVPFSDLAKTADRVNELLHGNNLKIDTDERRVLIASLLSIMESRIDEADSFDMSKMGWLALHLKELEKAKKFVQKGLDMNPQNYHCNNLASHLKLKT